jgi:hypothetical protein
MYRPGPELPSTAKCATVFGQLEVLSGKSRPKAQAWFVIWKITIVWRATAADGSAVKQLLPSNKAGRKTTKQEQS